MENPRQRSTEFLDDTQTNDKTDGAFQDELTEEDLPDPAKRENAAESLELDPQ